MVLRDPEITGGVEQPVEEQPVEQPIEQPVVDFNDPAVQAAIAAQANALAEQTFTNWQTEYTKIVPPQQQPNYNPYQSQQQVIKSPEQVKQETIAHLRGMDSYDDQLTYLTNLVFQSKDEARNEALQEIRGEYADSFQHSKVQSGTSAVVRAVPTVSQAARDYIEDIVEEYGFSPTQLKDPKNAKLVALAAEQMAYQAGAVKQPVQQTQGGTLFNQQQQRAPIHSAAPVNTQTHKSWRDGLNQTEQKKMEQMFATYTPPGMKPEQVFSDVEINQAIRDMRIQEQFSDVGGF